MTVAISPEALVSFPLTNRHLVDDQLWTRLVNRIAKDEDMELSLAERAMDQALGFMQLCAWEPDVAYAPSLLVDKAWETFIKYTRHYAAFCKVLGTDFVHHESSDEEGVDYSGGNNIAETVVALTRHGLVVDEMLWQDTGHICKGDGTWPCKSRQ